jgi:hypothetical protein
MKPTEAFQGFFDTDDYQNRLRKIFTRSGQTTLIKASKKIVGGNEIDNAQ